jgi:membrane-bound lytic murein transglycosylase A
MVSLPASRLLRHCAAAASVVLAGCGLLAPAPTSPPPVVSATPGAPRTALPDDALLHPRARWVAVGWSELPGWDEDRAREAWPALQRGCDKPAPAWALLCAQARAFTPADDAALRDWLVQRLQPYRIESTEGQSEGLATGYFEPLIDAARTPRESYRVPLYAPPADLAARKPYWTRQQLDTLPTAQSALRGREIAYVADPLDALLLQVQGSGRLRLIDGNAGARTVRLAFAAHNEQPYKSVGRWLIEQGELKAGEASWPAIRDWARRNPKRINELLWSNPRTVFFREEPLPDAAIGPRGAQGVPLTPGRSVAVDQQSVPYGTPLWLDTTEPLSSTPLRRLVLAQDTGTAIVGAVRVDFFWGWGSDAEAQAGRMKQALRMWALWPKDTLLGQR